MKLLYLLIPIIMVFTSCSKNEELEVSQIASRFYDNLEKKQYDSVYVMLSLDDQKNMAESVFVSYCKEWNLNPFEKENIAGDTLIIAKSEDNSFTATKKYFASNQEKVSQLKHENESYEEAIKRLAMQNELPLKSDSSFIKIIKEKSLFKIDLGLKNFKAYQLIWTSYMDSLSNLIKVEPVKLSIEKIGSFRIVKAEVNIQNHSIFDVDYLNFEMTYEKEVIGRIDLHPDQNNYKPDSLYMKIATVDLKAMPKLIKYAGNKTVILDKAKVDLKVSSGLPENQFKIIEHEIAKRSNFYSYSMFPMSKQQE